MDADAVVPASMLEALNAVVHAKVPTAVAVHASITPEDSTWILCCAFDDDEDRDLDCAPDPALAAFLSGVIDAPTADVEIELDTGALIRVG